MLVKNMLFYVERLVGNQYYIKIILNKIKIINDFKMKPSEYDYIATNILVCWAFLHVYVGLSVIFLLPLKTEIVSWEWVRSLEFPDEEKRIGVLLIFINRPIGNLDLLDTDQVLPLL